MTKIKGKKWDRSAYESVFYLSHQSPNQTCYTRKTVDIKGYRKNEDTLVFLNKITQFFTYVYA